MQERQTDRVRYFNELAQTSEKYFLPYIEQFRPLRPTDSVLEIGCGDGGNLLPIARRGCRVTGVDLSPSRIEVARRMFAEAGAEGRFIAADIFTIAELEHTFNLVICHDVLEHIPDKAQFMRNLHRYLAPDGVVYMSFPAWQMPFGGHQQICRSRVLSHLPFFHLLPRPVYRWLLERAGENEAIVSELLSIKSTRCPIEMFKRIARREGFDLVDQLLYFINPHYEVKFHLRPRKLWPIIAAIPWVRNFLTTSSFYIMRPKA